MRFVWICFAVVSMAQSTEKVDQHIQEVIERWGITGMSVAVVQNGKTLYHKGHGLADLSKQTPVTTETLFVLSSNTKMFSGTAAMILVEEGRLELDLSARHYLPQIPKVWEDVTVRMLLTHLSGLPNVIRCDIENEAKAWACVTKMERDGKPLSKFRYNQTNYLLVRQLIEKQSGMAYEDFLEQRIFKPAGMKHTLFEGDYRAQVPGRATGYVPDGKGGTKIREVNFPKYMYAAAGLNSTSGDMLSFMKALKAGQIVKKETLQQMWQAPRLSDGSNSHYGTGWDIQKHGNGYISLGHEGGGLTTFRYFPKADLLVVLLMNGKRLSAHPDTLAKDIAALYEPNIYTPGDRLVKQMWTALNNKNSSGAVAAYHNFLDSPEAATVNTEGEINSMGYDLLARERYQDAIVIFTLNVERYPMSGNVYDSLGEAYLKAGQKDLARINYKKSLQVDPQNTNAAKILQEELTL